MKKVIEFWNKIKPSRRKIIQLYTALLFNANIKGFVTGNIYKGNTKAVCVPGLNCYSCPGAVGACPLGSLQGSFNAGKSTVFYVFGILFLFGILFGRMICGFFCPFGLIQELLHKIKTPKLKKGPITRILSVFKYIVLVFFVLIVPILYALKDMPVPAFCKYICPAGTLEGGLGLLANKVNASYFSMLGPLFTWKFLLLVSFVVGSIFVFRLFCRFICPLGALYGLFNKFSFFGVKLEQSKCTQCGLCVSHCKMDIKHVGDQECISCGDCMGVCPTNAIQWKGPKILLRPNETETDTVPAKKKNSHLVLRSIAWGLALVVLGGAFVYYWNDSNTTLPTPTAPSPTGSTEIPQGNEVGNLCYGYDLEILNASGITGETINPVKTGKITIINFWGTWCGPCKAELPYFDQIAKEYTDTVTVIAIHTHMVHETAPAYISENYADTPIIFAKDYSVEGANIEGYYATLGGRGTYPYTVILDEDGIIVSVFVSALTYDDLNEVVQEQLKP